jgi:cardiolipin synthase
MERRFGAGPAVKFGRKARIIAATVVLTALAVLLIANFSLGDKKIDKRVESLYPVSDPHFLRTMGTMLGPSLLPGNRVQALVNGDQFFPAMLQAIRGAQRSITLETYIYWSGKIGDEFLAALTERARAGVSVHVLLDWVGSGKIDRAVFEQMKAAGIEVELYNPLRWYTLAQMNNRTHRKLLVIDGSIGFTGGAGIADEWTGNAQDPKHWRDTQFRIEGPAVAQMQAAFMENWIEATGVVLHGAAYFPPLERRGTAHAQVFVSSPGGGGESAQLLYLLSIASAAKSIRMSAAYFVPDNTEVRTFVAALERGVRVQIILPGPHSDAEVVRRASRAEWGKLLRAGAEIYEYQPTMFHCKVLVVDGAWTSVGSTNFDSRSFSVNDEANLNIYDGAFAAAQGKIFEEDLRRSRRVTLQEWENRPWAEKLWEHTMGLLSSQL